MIEVEDLDIQTKIMDNKKKQRLLSIDLGYSSAKICRYNEDGVLTVEKEISAIAKVENPLIADDDVIFNLSGDYFLIGPNALMAPRSCLLNLEKYEDLKIAYPAFVSSIVKRLGGFQAFDKIAIGLSLAYKDKGQDILDHLKNTLMVDDGLFVALPQGIMAKYCYEEYGLHVGEAAKKNYERLQSWLSLDGGFLTADLNACIQGTASASSAIGIENTGVICIAYDLIDYIFKNYEWRISPKEALTIIDNDGVWIRRGKEFNFSEQVKEFTKKYLSNVFNLVEDKFSDSLDNLQGILVIGGLSYLVNKYIEDPDIVKMIESHFPVSFLKVPKHHGEYYNAIGYMKFLEKMIDEGKM